MAVFQFVDSMADNPTVRLDLNNGQPFYIANKEIDMSPPPLRRAVATTMMVDGARIPATAWDNRVVKLPIQLVATNVDAAAVAIQALSRELCRETNILRVQLGSTPYYFRTFAAPDYAFSMTKLFAQYGIATLEIPAEPFVYGPKETLPSVTVSNDPDEGQAVNANPYFETDVSDWTATGGTFVRSTAQSHEGVASGLYTPDGVTATSKVEVGVHQPAVVGVRYRSSAWVRCAVSRNVVITLDWYTAANAFISSSPATIAVTANTWTRIDMGAAAPATTGLFGMSVQMTGTPAASNTLFVDEARMFQPGTQGGSLFDVTGIKGDMETPLVLRRSVTNVGHQSLFSTRRRGTPSRAPYAIQAEAMAVFTDTTTQPNDAGFSGAGNNYTRTTFATNATMTNRLLITNVPANESVDARGSYRVFARMRKNGTTSTINVRLAFGQGSGLTAVLSDPLPVTWTTPTLAEFTMNATPLLVTIPVGYDPVQDGVSGAEMKAGTIFMRLDAERIGGSDTLDVDYLLVVPADDRLSIVNWSDDPVPPPAFVLDGIHDMVYGLSSGGAIDSGIPGYYVGGPPMLSTDGAINRVYFINEVKPATAEPVFPTTFTLDMWYWPRYLYIRPAAS